MAGSITNSAFWKGVGDAAPFILIAGPFGLLFGVVGTESGLNILEVMVMTSLVIAGAAQFTALQLMSDNAPTLVVVATALAVNLRMAMYSAAMTPHLGAAPFWKRAVMSYFLFDQNYGISVLRYDKEPEWGLSEKISYYSGTIVPIAPIWIIMSYVGAVIGSAIPPELALDFALPITFLSMVAPALRTIAHVAAAATSIILTLTLTFIPFNLGLIIAAIVAMCIGAWVEVRMTKQVTS